MSPNGRCVADSVEQPGGGWLRPKGPKNIFESCFGTRYFFRRRFFSESHSAFATIGFARFGLASFEFFHVVRFPKYFQLSGNS